MESFIHDMYIYSNALHTQQSTYTVCLAAISPGQLPAWKKRRCSSIGRRDTGVGVVGVSPVAAGVRGHEPRKNYIYNAKSLPAILHRCRDMADYWSNFR